MDDRRSGGQPPQGEAGDLGGGLAQVRARISERLQKMADRALDTYEEVMSAPSRYSGSQLSAARDVLELLTEGKLQAPVQVRPTQPASTVELAKLSEQIRLVKQDERRRA
jgi:hypothetical protein